jgi:hypothetical protein
MGRRNACGANEGKLAKSDAGARAVASGSAKGPTASATRASSTLDGAATAAGLHTRMGQGSQLGGQQDGGTNSADQTVIATNPTRAASPTALARKRIKTVNPLADREFQGRS